MKKYFMENRKRIGENMPNNSVLVLFAGNGAAERNFYYLTGTESLNIIFVLHKNGGNVRETLYLERFDELKAKWVGAPLSAEEAERLSGIEACKEVDVFENDVASILFASDCEVLLDLDANEFDLPQTPAIKFANKIKAAFPAVKIQNAYKMFASARSVKSEYEIDCIKKAVDITCGGFGGMMKNARPGMFEYEIEAFFDFELKKNGVREFAFPTIAASGVNATVLHYSANKKKTKDGELILIDAGAKFGGYSADITRTFPVNGRFSDRQKLLYSIVLEGQKKVIEAIKPGVLFKSLNDVLIDFYRQELKKIELIRSDDELGKYYYHKVSHLLGLETHDCGRVAESGAVLKTGMVLTVEPGLYVAEEEIGIRIEDDVVVTESGCEVISAGIVKEIEDVEGLIDAREDFKEAKTEC